MDFKVSDFKKEYIVIVAIALLFSLLLLGCVSQTAAPTPSPEPLVNVVFVINNGTANYSKTLNVVFGTTVLAALETNFVVTKKEYSFGALVTGIDGTEQSDAAGLYWQYYVDGALAQVGASDFKLVENGTAIEWRLEKPPAFD